MSHKFRASGELYFEPFGRGSRRWHSDCDCLHRLMNHPSRLRSCPSSHFTTRETSRSRHRLFRRGLGSLILLGFTAFPRAEALAQPADPAAEAPAAEAPAAEAPAAEAPAAEAPAAEAPAAEAPAAEAPAAEAPAAEAPKPKPPPYSLPFQLRAAIPGSVIRSDTAFGFYENPANGASGSAVVSTLLASYKVTDELAPLLRLGVVSNSPPAAPAPPQPQSGFGFLNPVLGALYGLKLSDVRLAFFLGVALPLGNGGGDDPDPGQFLARNAPGILTRSAMDNAMFAVNDLVVFPGIDVAYVAHGFTAQVEATVLQLTRVRGKNAPAPFTAADSSRTNFTGGIHAGYFFIPMLSVGVELRHQRWLSTPVAVKNDTTDTLRDTTTVAFGPRLHFKLGEKTWLRPAIALALPLDDPMKKAGFKVVQLDVPFAF
jgi:hypothetical protein